MSIVKKIKKLNLPNDQYVVAGSGLLDALGIREASDIDIAVTNKLFKKLKHTNNYKVVIKYNKEFLVNTEIGIDIIKEISWEQYTTTTLEAISSAIYIEDIPFLNFEEFIKFKEALGRQKDFRDIKLLENYLDSHKQIHFE